MFENIRISLKGIVSHKMRSILTMLGVIIGITSIIVIVAIIQGATESLKNTLVGNETNTVTIGLYSDSEAYTPYETQYYGSVQGITKVSKTVLKAIGDLDGVNTVTPVYYITSSATHNSDRSDGDIYGVEKEYFSASNLYLIRGRLFNKSDYKNKHNVAVISAGTASQLFSNKDAIGSTVVIGDEMFVVVGVVDKNKDYSSINNLGDYYMKIGLSSNEVFIPSSSWETTFGFDDIQRVVIKIDNLDEIVNVSKKAAELLNLNITTDKYQYKSTSLGQDSEDLDQITSIAYLLLVGIASISLLVGGIGVMNIMLVSVTERTREIGLKKALGAKRKAILSQFLTEAVVLTALGGIIGVVLGVAIAKAVGMVVGLNIVISIPVIILAVGFSMFIGIVFGLIPSVKASKLDPIDALRYE